MLQKETWLLPEGIEEVLPEDARYLEQLRRSLLDVFAAWGYELVIPPMIDYLDSLLTGTGHDLDLQTFKLTDQLSGKLLGIRADMTPLVTRIDAHNLGYQRPTRLCYVGTNLHTRGDALQQTRSPMQIGAELYGHSGKESDLEVILLMLEMLAVSGLQNIHLDLSHVGIFRALAESAELNEQTETELFDVLQRKSKAELHELLNNTSLQADHKQSFLQLADLHGVLDVPETARSVLPKDNAQINAALDELEFLTASLLKRLPQLQISFDLSELRGYQYHTGVVFAAYQEGVGREIARGGRYDNIGEVFGRARPATGFSADLKVISSLSKVNRMPDSVETIYAPCEDDAVLREMVRDLRASGRTVIQHLPGQEGDETDFNCTSIIKKDGSEWVIAAL